jgi:hypothetical protein
MNSNHCKYYQQTSLFVKNPCFEVTRTTSIIFLIVRVLIRKCLFHNSKLRKQYVGFVKNDLFMGISSKLLSVHRSMMSTNWKMDQTEIIYSRSMTISKTFRS